MLLLIAIPYSGGRENKAANEGAKICIHTETDEIHFIEDHLSEGCRFVNSDIAKFFAFFKIYLCYRPEIVKVVEEEGGEPTEVIKKIKKKDRWTFVNGITGERQTFVFGDPSFLPWEPLYFVGRHVQEDLILMMQKTNKCIWKPGSFAFREIGRWSSNWG
ncbi:hypothetical protein GCM10011571_16140 [Marinithermofilum abyssi]|uniref:Uncharacterized protein n=1 Tax=Marinithermofilum abyssi TaxID=1571185 RepID=A0A8J2VGB2_9BACL|nr:hypothetical protein GCM10011571_16140 [Marinithermofilum abyssi]